jgi:hypothetical protein
VDLEAMNPKIIPLAIVLSLLLLIACYWILFIYVDQPCSQTMIIQYKRIQKHCESIQTSGVGHEVSWSHFWDPSWSCTLERRIGSYPNAKWLCDPHQIHPHGIVYSYRTSNSSFEEIIANNYQCNVHLFDPIVILASPSTPVHLSSERFSTQQFLESLQQNQYQGRNLDLLSFEIYDWISCSESSKMSSIISAFLLENLLTELEALQITIDQMIFNFHHEGTSHSSPTTSTVTDSSCQPFSNHNDFASAPSHQMSLLFQHLTSRGYAIYHREIVPRHSTSSSSPSQSVSHSRQEQRQRHRQQHHSIDRLEYSFVKLNIDCHALSVSQPSKYLSNT